MPIYVYRNLVTGDTFEVQQPITASAWTEHPDTGEPVKRIVQPVGIAFRGSGFYVTDSRGAKPGASSGKGTVAGDASPGDASAGAGSANDGPVKEKSASSEPTGASGDGAAKAPAKPAAAASSGASGD